MLQMRRISRRFGAINALREVDFELRAGEVMALLGENGAGKSTLVKILAGLIELDAGEVLIDGRPHDLRTPKRSRAAGIAVVQQELSLVPTLSVAENIFLGGGPFSGAWTTRRLARQARPLLARVGLENLDPNRSTGSLAVAEQQLVEIARVLARDARILILDEPTAALSDVEIERVMAVVRSVTSEGRGVVYVTHRLGEVFALGNRVIVFRNGESQAPVDVRSLTIDSLIERILGRRLQEMFPSRASSVGEAVLTFDEIQTRGLSKPVSLSVRKGEIVGLAGQIGSGAASLLRAAAGVQSVKSGRVVVEGRTLSGHSRRDAIRAGIAYSSDDRKRDGLFLVRTVTENLCSPALTRILRRGIVSRRLERSLARSLAESFQVDAGRLRHRAATLSGGNQQKVALGKWLGVEPQVLLVEEPTRGVDVGARAEIYAQIRRVANEGVAVCFSSSDLPEVLGLADTVATFYRGRLVRIVPAVGFGSAELLRDVTHPPQPLSEDGLLGADGEVSGSDDGP